MKLSSVTYGQPTNPPLILMHGLFGSGKLWRVFAQKFSKQFWVHTPDARNHGQSPHHPSMTLQDMSDDLLEYMNEQGLNKAHILAHSMGGKVAMQFALDNPERIDRLLIEDISPVFYEPRHDDLFKGVHVINSHELKSRAHAEELTKDIIKDAVMRQFLFTNLAKNKDGKLTWFINMEAIEQNYSAISEPPKGKHPQYDGAVLFLRGGASPYVLDDYRPAIKKLFPLSRINTIKSAGHFLHSQDPDSFMRISLAFFNPTY